jgi:hypothetical protein
MLIELHNEIGLYRIDFLLNWSMHFSAEYNGWPGDSYSENSLHCRLQDKAFHDRNED